MQEAKRANLVAVPMWDIWVRLFHWALVGAITTSFVTEKIGNLETHYLAGLAVLGLVIFRFLWGLIGSPTARFSHFLRGPSAVLRYLRRAVGRKPSYTFGHNPAGGAMVALMLLALAFQAVSGLFNTDDILFEGPLYDNASGAVAGFFVRWHGVMGNVILALVALHILVILLYRVVKGENLISAMIVGRAKLPPKAAANTGMTVEFRSGSGRAMICIGIAVAIPMAIYSLN